MRGLWQVFGGAVIRAFLFIGLVSAAIWRLTGNARLVRAYCAAHLAAIALGTAVDVALCRWIMTRGGVPAAYMNAIFLAPIVFFIGFSLFLCHRDTVLHAGDVLLTIAPVVAWGFLVVFGWQDVSAFDVLGAWFVSAACGGVDLVVRFGPERLGRTPYLAKTAGYAGSLFGVYLALPYIMGH